MSLAARATEDFGWAMQRLGPFEPRPFLGVAVSGGADSMATALLAADWARARGGDVLAIVVDHGLRRGSASEASLVTERLLAADIASVGVLITGLEAGPGVAARARAARHAALEAQCAMRGILHLLFGHHAADQAETVQMRADAGSGPAGLAGMAGLVERCGLRVLRPLLQTPRAALLAMLQARGVAWVDDPSNQDISHTRARVRLENDDPRGDGAEIQARIAAAAERGCVRADAEAAAAVELAERVTWHRGGFAQLLPGPLSPVALAGLLAAVSGAAWPVSAARVVALAAAPRPATMAGVRLLPAGRLGVGLLLVREAAAMAGPVAAVAGAVWDGRFRLTRRPDGPGSLVMSAWGVDARAARTGAPAAALRTLPALRREGTVVCGPWDLLGGAEPLVLHAPAQAAAGAPFLPLPARAAVGQDCALGPGMRFA